MQPIKRKKLYEDVMAGIIELIKRENLQAGDKLQGEKELAAHFGVSRMVVRESLSVLQSTGVIQVRHGSGIYVNDINERLLKPLACNFRTPKEKLLQILEVRAALEAEAAYLAAGRATAEHIAEIKAYLEKLAAEIRLGKETAHEDDLQFHRAIVRAVQNPVYSQIFDEIANIFFDDMRVWHRLIEQSFGPRFVVIEEHEAILRSIQAGEPASARDCMREHLQRVSDTLRKIL